MECPECGYLQLSYVEKEERSTEGESVALTFWECPKCHHVCWPEDILNLIKRNLPGK